MRVIGWIVGLPVAVLVLMFAVANRGPVTVSLDPFDTAAPTAFVELPLFLILFATLFLGVLVGGAAVWFGQGRHRRAARQARTEARLYRQEAETLKAERGEAAEFASVDRRLPAPAPF